MFLAYGDANWSFHSHMITPDSNHVTISNSPAVSGFDPRIDRSFIGDVGYLVANSGNGSANYSEFVFARSETGRDS